MTSLNQSSQATPQQLSAPQTPVTPSTVEEESQIAPANKAEDNFPHKGEIIAYKDETNIGANEVAVSKEDAANTEEMLAALRESNSQLMDLTEEVRQCWPPPLDAELWLKVPWGGRQLVQNHNPKWNTVNVRYGNNIQ